MVLYGGDADGEGGGRGGGGDKITPGCVLSGDEDEDACACLSVSLLVQLRVAVCLSECLYECILAGYLTLPSPPISFTPLPLLFAHSLPSTSLLSLHFPFIPLDLILILLSFYALLSIHHFPFYLFIISFFFSSLRFVLDKIVDGGAVKDEAK